MHRFKAVIFDFGGVIELSEGEVNEKIAKALSIPIDKFREAYHQYNHLTNVGNIKWEDAAIETVRVFDKGKETENHIRAIIRDHNATKRINTGLLRLFAALRKAGYKVAILSNNTTDLRDRLSVAGITPLLDEIVISAEIGHQKPHKEAFDVAFKKLDVRPDEVIFVDDSPKSLEKASEIGYQPVLFKDNDQLEAELKKLKIRFQL